MCLGEKKKAPHRVMSIKTPHCLMSIMMPTLSSVQPFFILCKKKKQQQQNFQALIQFRFLQFLETVLPLAALTMHETYNQTSNSCFRTALFERYIVRETWSSNDTGCKNEQLDVQSKMPVPSKSCGHRLGHYRDTSTNGRLVLRFQ